MGKFLSRFFLIVIVTFTSIVIFLSYFGLETNKFDKLIKNKSNEVSQYVKLEFTKTKIYLNPIELNLIVKLQNPEVLVKNKAISLSKLDLFLSLKSFFSSDFLLKRAEVAFIENDIKDLTKITNIFVPKIINKRLNKIFAKGSLEGEFVIPFQPDGSIGKNYGFSGKVSEAAINLTKEFSIKNLTIKINHHKSVDGNVFELTLEKGFVHDVKLAESTINLKQEKNNIKIKSLLKTNGKLNFSQIKKISSLFGLNTNNLKNANLIADLKTNINFDINKKFKIKNLLYSTEGDISHLEVHTKEKKIIKKYLPDYDSKVILKDTNIKFINSESKHSSELIGFVKVNDNFDSFKLKEMYDYSKKIYDVNGEIELTNSRVKVSQLNYVKDKGKKSQINFDINFIPHKYYSIKSVNFSAGNNKIYLSDIKLDKNLGIENFKKLEIKTSSNDITNNDFLAKKLDQVIVSGKLFDAEPILKSIYKKSDKKTFGKKFSSKIKINIDRVLTGTNDEVLNLAMIGSINKGSYNKLSLKGKFSENEIIEMSIYQVDKDNKTLQVVSDRARPFIKNFDFIKGFEGGKLAYETIISQKVSQSNLQITDFKVSKVPALAQLLTLASLQGIADTLSGEGIRFESFEMKSNSEGNVLNIEDALAMGPAISILLDGYVDKGKVVSLRGTLVPATKLNSIIASIPVVGEILVGKKTGEGIVGVSFKMKGPPKDIKTTVNPIKTLTPRFIVRAVERMKKKKQEEIK